MPIWLVKLVERLRSRNFTGKVVLNFCKGDLTSKIEKREVEKVNKD